MVSWCRRNPHDIATLRDIIQAAWSVDIAAAISHTGKYIAATKIAISYQEFIIPSRTKQSGAAAP